MNVKLFEKILDITYRACLYGFLSFMVYAFITHAQILTMDIQNIQDRQHEIYANQVILYNNTQREINALTYALLANDGKLDSEIQKVKSMAENMDAKYKVQLNAFIKTLREADAKSFDSLNKKIEEKTKRPSYEYLKSITTYHFRSIPGEKRVSIGTGVIVKITNEFTYILTNKHIVKDCPKVYECIVLNDDETQLYDVEIVKESATDYDMVLVRIAGRIPGKQAVIGISSGTYQDRVFMVGHNLGRPYLYSEGTIAGYDPELDFSLVVGMPSAPGNSGSGIINTDGELVGLLYRGAYAGRFPFMTLDLTHGICVDGKVLKLFLADIL